MTDKRDVSQPTQISICLPGDYLLIKDLNGKPHIFPKSELSSIGAKIIELASDNSLPFADVGHVSLGDEKSTVTSSPDGLEFDLDDLDPDKMKKQLFKVAANALGGMISYPRGTTIRKPTATVKK